MTKFDADTLRELRDEHEVAIRTEKHPESAVVIWVVVADDEVFLRSVRGSKGRWYRGDGRVRHIGIQRPPAGGSGAPRERRRCDLPGQPRIFEKVPAEPLRAIDGSRRGPADHIAGGTALTSRTLSAAQAFGFHQEKNASSQRGRTGCTENPHSLSLFADPLR